MQTLDQLIKSKSNDMGMSLLELSRKSDIPYQTIMSCKHRKPKINTLQKFAKALNLNIMDLINAPVKNKTK